MTLQESSSRVKVGDHQPASLDSPDTETTPHEGDTKGERERHSTCG